MRTANFQMFKLDVEKAEEPEINIQHHWTIKKKKIPDKHLLLLY